MKKQKDDKAGDVYVITNDSFKKQPAKFFRRNVPPVKIGNGKDCITRVGNLSSAVCDDFKYHLILHSDNRKRCEADLQAVFHQSRIYTKTGGRTEYFAYPLKEMIIEIRKYIDRNPEKNIVIRKDCGVEGEVFGRSASSQRTTLRKREEERKLKRQNVAGHDYKRGKPKPNFNFAMIGLKNGAPLVFIPTGAKVTAVVPNKVRQGGKEYTLTGYAKEYMPKAMRNSKGAYQGPAYFTYKGKKLTVLREEMEGSRTLGK